MEIKIMPIHDNNDGINRIKRTLTLFRSLLTSEKLDVDPNRVGNTTIQVLERDIEKARLCTGKTRSAQPNCLELKINDVRSFFVVNQVFGEFSLILVP
jgi:hypothetical protein